MVGLLSAALGGFCFAVVVMYYFSKWVEAEPLAKVKAKDVGKFFWKSVVCHFSVPLELTIDNGKLFEAAEF